MRLRRNRPHERLDIFIYTLVATFGCASRYALLKLIGEIDLQRSHIGSLYPPTVDFHGSDGTPFADCEMVLTKESDMGAEDVVSGKIKQIKGKANDIAGAVKGDTAQQIKGKIQKGVGKVQEALGKDTSKSRPDMEP